jgi:hypothetical protein
MVLDRDLRFTEDEVKFDSPLGNPNALPDPGAGPDINRNHPNNGTYGRNRFPL